MQDDRSSRDSRRPNGQAQADRMPGPYGRSGRRLASDELLFETACDQCRDIEALPWRESAAVERRSRPDGIARRNARPSPGPRAHAKYPAHCGSIRTLQKDPAPIRKVLGSLSPGRTTIRNLRRIDFERLENIAFDLLSDWSSRIL